MSHKLWEHFWKYILVWAFPLCAKKREVMQLWISCVLSGNWKRGPRRNSLSSVLFPLIIYFGCHHFWFIDIYWFWLIYLCFWVSSFIDFFASLEFAHLEWILNNITININIQSWYLKGNAGTNCKDFFQILKIDQQKRWQFLFKAQSMFCFC